MAMRPRSTVAVLSAVRCVGEISVSMTREVVEHGPMPSCSAFFMAGAAISQIVAVSPAPSACRNFSYRAIAPPTVAGDPDRVADVEWVGLGVAVVVGVAVGGAGGGCVV